MDLKLICMLVVCLYHLTPACAKPTNFNHLKNGDLAEKFVEFLEQDKQFAELMAKVEADPDVLTREKRQTKNNVDDIDLLGDNTPEQKQDGFFDRAAKFMMELLQRFLKWVNTD